MARSQVEVKKFKEWDEFSAYLLGYFLGDGNLFHVPRRSGGDSVRVCIYSADYEHLFNIKEVLNPDLHIHTNAIGVSQISFMSNYLGEVLESIGLCPRKSIVGCILNRFPDKENLWHFIRGLFDSDGYISLNLDKRYNKYYVDAGLLGHESYIKQIKELIKFKWLTDQVGKVYSISISDRNQLKEFYLNLYKGANIFLKRKKLDFDFYWKNYDIRKGRGYSLQSGKYRVVFREKCVGLVKTEVEAKLLYKRSREAYLSYFRELVTLPSDFNRSIFI